MTFLNQILEPPSYGWKDDSGNLVKPSNRKIFQEFISRLNILNDKKNWLSFLSWLLVVALIPFLALFFFKYFTWTGLIIAFVYSMIFMGTHGTIWHHRYCTHKAYRFINKFWRFFTQNLTLRIIPEEIYAISHHVHHALSDKPGDPYNVQGGFLYCFLADVNHQPIARNLNEVQYKKCMRLMNHVGIRFNTFTQYQKWGTLANPFRTLASITFNWSFWFSVFYLIGGMPLACAIFGSASVWAIGVRTFNYDGHGNGKDKRRDGIDYNRNDMSINQLWPGYIAGEWHNNHHLYPGSARSGFQRHQLDLAWCYIKFMYIIGAVSSFQDDKQGFLKKYHHKRY